jgi:hypothetical protein
VENPNELQFKLFKMKRLREISDNSNDSLDVETKGRSDNPIRCASTEVRSPLCNFFAYMHALEQNDDTDSGEDQVDILDLIGCDATFVDSGFEYGKSYAINNYCCCTGLCKYDDSSFSFYKICIPQYSVTLTVVTRHPVLFYSTFNTFLQEDCGFYRYVLTDKFHRELATRRILTIQPSDGPFSIFSDYSNILAINWNRLMHAINGNGDYAAFLSDSWNRLMHSINGNMEEDDTLQDGIETEVGNWEGLTGTIPGKRLIRSTSMGNLQALKSKGPGLVNNSRLANNGGYGNFESDEGDVGFDRGLTEDDYLIGVPPNLNKIGQVIGTNKYHQKRATNLREKRNFMNKHLDTLTDKSKFIKGQTKQFYSKVSFDGDGPLPGAIDVSAPPIAEEKKKRILNMVTKFSFLPRYEYTIESDELDLKPRTILQRFYKSFRNVTNSPFAPVLNALSNVKVMCSAVVATFVGKLMNSLFDFKNNLFADSETFRLFLGLLHKCCKNIPYAHLVKLCCGYLILALVYKLLQCSYYKQFRAVTTVIVSETPEKLGEDDDPRREREKYHDGVHNPIWVEFYEEREDFVRSGIEIPIIGKFLKSNTNKRLHDSETKIAEKENVIHMLENKNVAPTLSPIAVMNRLSSSVTIAPFVKVDRSRVLSDNVIANSTLLATAINFHSRCRDLNDAFNVGFPTQGPIRLVRTLRNSHRPST